MAGPHAVLQIPELRDMILSDASRGSLANMVRVSRAFHLHASAVLWKKVGTLAMLALAEIVLEQYGSAIMPLSTAARWERLEFYASCIRDLGLHFQPEQNPLRGYLPEYLKDDERKILRDLMSLRPSICILPRLQSLSCLIWAVADIEIALSCLSPSLEAITVRCMDVEDMEPLDLDVRIGMLLNALQANASQLRNISLHGELGTPLMSFETLRDVVAVAQRLETFECDVTTMTSQLLGELSLLPFLANLSITKGLSPEFSVSFPNIREFVNIGSFPSLKQLYFDGHLQTATAFLGVGLQQLSDLTISSRNVAVYETDLLDLTRSISQTSQNLVSVRFQLLDMPPGSPDPIGWDAFTPLLNCRAITSFRLSFVASAQVDLRDHHVEAMAHAWPLLEEVEIALHDAVDEEPSGPHLVDPTALTFAALVILATHCPLLESIQLPYDALLEIPIPPSLRPSPLNYKLDIGRARIHHAEHFAIFVSLMWPNCDVWDGFYSDEDPVEFATFQSVNRILKALQCYRDLQARALSTAPLDRQSTMSSILPFNDDA